MLKQISNVLGIVKDNSVKSVIKAATFSGIRIISTSAIYALLPVILTAIYNEMLAGIAVSAGTIFQLMIVPFCGELIKKIGAVKVMRISILSFLLTGVIFLLIGLEILPAQIGIWFVIVFLFVGYSFNSIKTYVLQMSPKESGGLLFGLVSSITSVGSLIATLLLPYLEHQSYIFIGGITIFLMSLIFAGTFTLRQPKIKPYKKDKNMFNFFSTLQRGFYFVKKNKYFPVFQLITVTFQGFFYASIWFLVPLLIAKSPDNFLGGMSLGVYEIVTILLAAFFGWIADKYNWKTLYFAGWILVLGGIMIFNLHFVNIFIFLLIGGVFIGIGDNMISGASSHILEKKDKNHKEDAAFIVLQKFFSNI